MPRKTISNRSKQKVKPEVKQRNKSTKNQSILRSVQKNETEEISEEILNSREPAKVPNETFEPPVLNPFY
ncbi:MAG: hypothetical protein PHY93_01510 [Bacteriovorax sp.]|nr:hypothetical protein [Bacteriovorax sp.]